MPQTVVWIGDQEALAHVPQLVRLPGADTVAVWTQEVRDHCLPWLDSEVEAATRVCSGLVALFLRRRIAEQDYLTSRLGLVNAELEALAYSVAHDLRAPLRHISGYGDLIASTIADRPDTPARVLKPQVEALLRASEWGGVLIDDLLSFSRLGREQFQSSTVDVTAIVDELIHIFTREHTGREIVWTVGDLPTVVADPILLRRALHNLIDNAVKYTSRHDRARIDILGEQTADEIVYTVCDDGVGFDMTYSGKLFGVFQRLHAPDDFSGTGIGLASVRRIVERHGGRVFARGELLRGASVGFALPLVPRQETS